MAINVTEDYINIYAEKFPKLNKYHSKLKGFDSDRMAYY
jgi:hypothetical protein